MNIKPIGPPDPVNGRLRVPAVAAALVAALAVKAPAATLQPQPAKHIEEKAK